MSSGSVKTVILCINIPKTSANFDQVWAVHETQNLTIIKDTERSDLDEVENCIY